MKTLIRASSEVGGVVPQVGLLKHVWALQSALTRRWQYRRSPWHPAVLAQWASSAAKVQVLIVAEARSGSTLLGELAFDPRAGEHKE